MKTKKNTTAQTVKELKRQLKSKDPIVRAIATERLREVKK